MSEPPRGTASGALALALLCSAAAAMPAILRIAPRGEPGRAAVALIAATSLVVVPLGFWLRRAISAGLPATDRALLGGVALSALPLALFGGVLKSTTHHRPLGGATFAVAALCLLALCMGLSFRILRGDRPSASGPAVRTAWQNLFTVGCGLSLGAVMVLGLSRAARPSLIDFSALLAGGAAAGIVKLPAWQKRLPLPATMASWMLLLACAVVSLQNGALVRSLTTQAPVSFAALSWLGVGS